MQGKGLIATLVAVVVIVLAIGAVWLLPENEPSRTAVQTSQPPTASTGSDRASTGTPDIAAPSLAVPPAPPSDTSARAVANSVPGGANPPQSSGAAEEPVAAAGKMTDQAAKPADSTGATHSTEQAEKESETESARQGAASNKASGETDQMAAVTQTGPRSAEVPETVAKLAEPSGTPQQENREEQLAVVTPLKQSLPATQPATIPPSFDVVRISQQCTAVIAGRAEPGAQVTVWDGERPLGQVMADPRGEWVLVVGEPMRGGSRQLKLIAIGADETPIESASVVVIAVPDCEAPKPDKKKEAVIAVMTPKEGGASQVLQAPEPENKDDEPKGLALKSVDYDEKGEVVLSGKAEPGKSVQAYVDNKPVGAAQADEEGRWEVKPDEAIQPGVHKLRVDQVGQEGKVAARIELPFSRASAAQIILAPGHVVVQPGNSLWRIARRTYGHGLRYTVIYQANKGQIRDPDLIYPGQIFNLPRVN